MRLRATEQSSCIHYAVKPVFKGNSDERTLSDQGTLSLSIQFTLFAEVDETYVTGKNSTYLHKPHPIVKEPAMEGTPVMWGTFSLIWTCPLMTGFAA